MTLVACYLPYGIMSVRHTHSKLSSTDFLIGGLTVTLVYLQAVKETIREVLC